MAPDTELTARPSLHLRRVFAAPRELVWRAWTQPEMMLAWYGPVEFPAAHVERDLRPGGAWRACLRSATEDRVLWHGGVFHEIDPPGRLVFSFKWESDDHEDGTPVDTLVTVMLTELPDGRTQMDFTQTGLKSEASVTGHSYGWTSSFDRFDRWQSSQETTA